MINKLKQFFKWFLGVLKQLADPLTIIIFIILWFIVSGVGLAIVGTIIGNYWLSGLGLTIFAFWVGPATPLIPLLVIMSIGVKKLINKPVERYKEYLRLTARMRAETNHKRIILILAALFCVSPICVPRTTSEITVKIERLNARGKK